jgi:serine/threonine protein kinase
VAANPLDISKAFYANFKVLLYKRNPTSALRHLTHDFSELLKMLEELKQGACTEFVPEQTAHERFPETGAHPDPSRNNTSSENLIGKTIDDRYKVISLLGEGGMASVYKAQQIRTQRTVALKVLHSQKVYDEMHRMRLMQEARAACSLNHPNAVQVYDCGITYDGIPYLCMQYVEGVTLADEILQKGVITEEFAVQIFKQIADALNHAHEQHVLHRDIKPSNIMLVADKSQGRRAVVLDFGIAKLQNENQALTKTGDVFGTPYYMSPEQCQGEKLDKRSDVYSLGCVMYEALAGRPPFTGDSFLQVVYRQVSAKPAPLSSLSLKNPVSPGFRAIVEKCLEKDPRARFQSMAELRRSLDLGDVVKHGLANSGKHGRLLRLGVVLGITACLTIPLCQSVLTGNTEVAVSRLSTMPSQLEPVPEPENLRDWHAAWDEALAALNKDNFDEAQKYLASAATLAVKQQASRREFTKELLVSATSYQYRARKFRDDTNSYNKSHIAGAYSVDTAQLSEFLLFGKQSNNCFLWSERALLQALNIVGDDEKMRTQLQYHLAMTYFDWCKLATLNWETKSFADKAESWFERIRPPGAAYMLHDYGTFLSYRGDFFKNRWTGAPPEQAKFDSTKAEQYWHRAAELLNLSVMRAGENARKHTGEQREGDEQLVRECRACLGKVHHQLGDYQQAEADYQLATDNWTDPNRHWRIYGKWTQNWAVYQDWFQIGQIYENWSENSKDWSRQLRKKGDLAGAEHYIQRAVEQQHKYKS